MSDKTISIFLSQVKEELNNEKIINRDWNTVCTLKILLVVLLTNKITLNLFLEQIFWSYTN